jgi:hypothetical protein
VGVEAVIADALRLTCGGKGGGTIRVDRSTKLALRAVPVRVRSACLNSRAKSCNAIKSVPSTSSFMGWMTVLGACSLHQIAAINVPVSPFIATVGTASLRETLTGVMSNPNV